ncbi:MAG: MaoC family dehydratase N-terminal domain-containing protein [Pseudomonadota bacterium]
MQIGQTQRATDLLDPARAAALHQTLGLDGPPPVDVLPPFWHQIYFWDPHPPEALGPDSHPRVGQGVIPDLGLPRRMWAGGALEFLAPLRLGAPAEKVSTLTDVQRKEGRSGALGFVTLTHEIVQGGEVCVRERQDLVYRDPSPAARALPQARSDEHVKRRVTFDPTLLFRYSALTFNGHRIHYDADYARDVEGYAGLVVHGPLLAQLLIHLAVAQLGSLKSFAFRATAPLMDFEPADLCWVEGSEMWVRGPDGRQCMTAKAM